MVLAVLNSTTSMSCVPKNMWQYCWREISAVAYNLFSALSVKARDSPSTCCVETNIALLLACSNITVLATATTRTIHFFFFRFICRPERTGPIKCSIMCYFFFNPADLPTVSHTHVQSIVAVGQQGRTSEVSQAVYEPEEELLLIVPVLHIAKEALQFIFTTYQQFD